MRRLAFVLPIALWAAACDGGGGPTLEQIPPQSVRVNEELRVNIAIDNPNGDAVVLRVEDPMLPAFDSVHRISTEPGGAVFRWSPLSSQVGEHELVFNLTDTGGGTVYDSKTMLVEVLASEDSAPVFVHPGPGGTYDLERDPCVRFDIEVLDDDSADVDISSRAELPERASLNPAGPKRASFDWCPTPDQVASSERWTIQLQADDGEPDHLVEHDYVIVLRTGNKEGCPGAEPMISVQSPSMGEAITSGTTYPVEVTVSDDMGLRDPPLLYYTTTAPEDPSMPDVTQFEQVVFEDVDGTFVARIPNLGLDEGAMTEVWFLVSATDNDDPNGSLCDHRTDSDVVSFFAVGGQPADGSLPQCDFCTNSTECASGICAATASGGRCVDSCSGGGMCTEGVCGATVTTEGASRAGCGPTSEICTGGGGGGPCMDDGREDDDVIADATPYTSMITDGQICENDDDFFSISVPQGNRVTVLLDGFMNSDGDLDLSLRQMDGTILDTSASVRDMEEVEYCNAGTTETLYARVSGFLRDENAYDLTMSVAPDPGMCCMDDTFEDDDSQMAARSVSFGAPVMGTETAAFDGTVCGSDDDWIAIPMTDAGRIEVDLVFIDADGDLDIRLFDPMGTRIASSLSTSDDESIGVDVSGGGTYALQISLFGGGGNDYLGEVRRITGMGCTTTDDCPRGTVCDAGSCVSDICTGSCPPGHICQTGGPIPAANRCGLECMVNADCRSGEACKWNIEGRACGDTGSGQNGDSCSSFAACGGQRACLPYPGGYCARVGCTRGTDCETGTHCVEINGQNVCALHCIGFPSPCRTSEGYTCSLLPSIMDRESTPNRFVCVPP